MSIQLKWLISCSQVGNAGGSWGLSSSTRGPDAERKHSRTALIWGVRRGTEASVDRLRTPPSTTPEPGGSMRVSQSTFNWRKTMMQEPERAGRCEPAFEMLEPCAGKLARRVLRGVRGL